MEFIIELLIECFAEIVIDSGVDVMSSSSYTKNWPRGLKIALIIFTVLFFGIVIIGLIVMGILFLIKGELLPGVVLSLLGIGLLFGILFRIWKEYRKRNNTL